MEKEDASPKIKPGNSKSIRKSPAQEKSSDQPKKTIRFKLEPDKVEFKDSFSCSESENNDELCSVDPPAKKRKKDTKMPEVSNELEEEIERQYDSKAEKSNLSVVNVKNILKSVITNKYVVDMVRQTVEEGGVIDVPFGPKLTRAKTKELLQQHAGSPLPPVVGYLTPVKTVSSEINPEMKLLIDKELAEDSSDEEYNPDNEEEQSDDEEKGDTSLVSDLDSMPPTPASLPAPPTPLQDWSQDSLFRLPQENVGQRTRSKLDLVKLPLESLEQAFVPPDITHDMYEAECDNPDWHEFLKEFTQPLQLNETLEDDVDNDPEYNILEDEAVVKVDKEEMRKDRAVKVTKKELNALMTELFDYTDNLSSDEENNTQTTESILALEMSIMKETEDRQRREDERKQEELRKLEEESRKREAIRRKEEEDRRGFHPHQKYLLAQQMRQHVQLTTQHFLQTYNHPRYHSHSQTYKSMLITLIGLKNDNICRYGTENMAAAMDTVNKWEELQKNPENAERIRKFILQQTEKEKVKRQNKKKMDAQFSEDLVQLVVESEVFMYPMLLPCVPFLSTLKRTGPNSFTASENMLLAICLEQVTQLVNENSDLYQNRWLKDLTNVIYNICIPRSTPQYIAAHIRKLKASKCRNPIKDFFETGERPKILHYVISIQQGLKLRQLPRELLPQVWRNYLCKEPQECQLSESHAVTSSSSKISPLKSANRSSGQRASRTSQQNLQSTENSVAKSTSKTAVPNSASKSSDPEERGAKTSVPKPASKSSDPEEQGASGSDPVPKSILKSTDPKEPVPKKSILKVPVSSDTQKDNKYEHTSQKKTSTLNGQLSFKLDNTTRAEVKVIPPSGSGESRVNSTREISSVANNKKEIIYKAGNLKGRDALKRRRQREKRKESLRESSKNRMNFSAQCALKGTVEVEEKKDNSSSSKVKVSSKKYFGALDLKPKKSKPAKASCQRVLSNSLHELSEVSLSSVSESVSEKTKMPCENGLEEVLPQSSSDSTSVESKYRGVNNIDSVKCSTRIVSHRPKPPSTVKLKPKYQFNKGKKKVPTSLRQTHNVTS